MAVAVVGVAEISADGGAMVLVAADAVVFVVAVVVDVDNVDVVNMVVGSGELALDSALKLLQCDALPACAAAAAAAAAAAV